MKISKVLSISVLAGVVLLSSSACSGQSGNKETPTNSPTSSSASAKPEVTTEPAQTETPTSPATDASKVASVVNGYYAYVLAPGNSQKVQDAGSLLNGKSEVTDADLKTVVNTIPEGFKFFDTSSSQLTKNAYGQLLMASSIGESFPGMKIILPSEAVTIDGDKAVVNPTRAKIINNGKIVESDAAPYSGDVLNLVKKENGSWVIAASATEGTVEGTVEGSGEATIEDNTEVNIEDSPEVNVGDTEGFIEDGGEGIAEDSPEE